MTDAPPHILLVEDSPADVELAREVFDEFDEGSMELSIVEDGEQALKFLNREPPYEGVSGPDLMLLDLDLPKKDGFTVLEEVKSTEQMKLTPVIILTMSNADEDIDRAYDLGANCCLTKPLGFKDFKDLCRLINDFWFDRVELPRQ